MAITVISYYPSVIVTFIRPPPFGVLPRSARLPYLFSPKGPRLEGELACSFPYVRKLPNGVSNSPSKIEGVARRAGGV